MSLTFTSPEISSRTDWDEIARVVHETCVLRCEGREAEAMAMLETQLPGMIRTWSTGSGLSGEECRRRLRELFAQAQQQVATAQTARRLVLSSLGREDGKNDRRAPGRLQVRRRVAIDDVAGMLDALDENDRLNSRSTTLSPTRRAVATAVGSTTTQMIALR